MLGMQDCRPRPGFVIIHPAAEREQSEGGIYLSEIIERRQVYGEIVSAGEGVTEVEEGDWVLYRRWEGEHFSLDPGTLREDACYMICRADALQAVLNGNVVQPCGRWVALKPIDETVRETPCGILIAETGYLNTLEYDGTPDSIRQDEINPPAPPNKGEVVAIGPDCREVQCGETVICEPWVGTEINIAGTDYLMVREEQILVKLC